MKKTIKPTYEKTQRERDEENVAEFFSVLNSPLPSLNRIEYWLTHYSKHEYKEHTEFGGKWLIFCSSANVDKLWAKIKKAQDKLTLGNMSKTSTALVRGKFDSEFVICVYTYDSTDLDDVMRVRKGLSDLGIIDKIPYKRDIETINGVYGTDDEFLLSV